jgi:hypothetical protein
VNSFHSFSFLLFPADADADREAERKRRKTKGRFFLFTSSLLSKTSSFFLPQLGEKGKRKKRLLFEKDEQSAER